MEENRVYEYDEIEIDLMDLLVRLLRHWRSLIIAIVIGLAIGGGFGYMKAAKATPTTDIDELESYVVDPDVEKNMELASGYRKLYVSQLNYNENAILMKMDPNHLYQANIRYYMKGGEDTKLIAENFRMLLNRDDVREKLKKASGDVPVEYLMEVIGCGIDLNVGYQGSVFNAGPDMYDLVVNYSINYPDSDSIKPVLKALKKIINSEIDCVSNNYEDFTWQLVDDSLKEIVVPDYINRQKNSIDILNTYLTNYTKIEGNFKGKDTEYYKKIYLGEKEGIPDDEVLEKSLNKKTIIKWAIIVTFLACCVWGGIICMLYLFDGKIKTVDEFKNRYGLKVLGYTEETKNKSGIDGLIERLAATVKPIVNDESYIDSMKNSLGAEHVLEVGETPDGFIHDKLETLEKAKSADGIIINAKLNTTTYKQLDRELDVCRIQGIKVLGVVCRG